MDKAERLNSIIFRARTAVHSGKEVDTKELIGLIEALRLDLDRCESLLAENIREVEEVAATLCGWTEGEDHPEDMRVSLACAALLSKEDAGIKLVREEPDPYIAEKRGKILIVQDGKFAAIECYDGSLVLPMGISLTGESAAQAACRGADLLAGLSAEVTYSFAPFFSAEDGAATSVFRGYARSPSRPHPVHAVGYLRWVDFQEARRRLSGVDAKALSSFFPEDKWGA